MNKRLIVLLVSAGLSLGGVLLQAQQPAAPAPGQAPAAAPNPGAAANPAGGAARGGGRGGAPALIDFATARKVIDAAEAAAVAANVRVAIAVVDANGDLVYLRRLDGASAQGVTTSQGKARAAILFGLPTKEVADAVAAQKQVAAMLTPAAVGTGPVTIQQGGVPVLKDGRVIAGIGVGGASPAVDETIAKAGADAAR